MKRLPLLFSIFLATSALAAGPNADATAKFLAGLPLKGTPLAKQAENPDWIAFAADFDRDWKRLEAEQLTKIRKWAAESLGSSYEDRGPLHYMFSGPDFLYAHAFFPNAGTYILSGIEPVGSMPDIDKIPPEALPSSLANLRKSLESVFGRGYFITKYMMADLKQTQLNGTLPVLYIFLARAGCTVDSVTMVALDSSGKLVTPGKETTPGVKILFHGPKGRSQALYYFAGNLADSTLKTNPGFIKFCEEQGRGVSFLKAAAYLMASDNFSIVRNFLLTHSKLLLQDESGIPYRFIEPEKWEIKTFAKDVDVTKAERLPFSFGYEQRSAWSLMVARPK
ncbi:MAG: hypothetical protein DMF06_04455 [Verrucomicrobia bacterium]|nr:MAG: hypothetical protein DMF06_04455 [Verrucomicrobiota bacterium]